MRQYWFKLQDRERRTVLLGVTVLAVAVVYMLFSRSLEERNVLQQKREELLARELWLNEQADLLAQLDSVCAGVQPLQQEPEVLLRQLAQQAKVDIVQLTVSDNLHTLNLGGEGNDVLLLVQQSMCQGLALESITLLLTESARSEPESDSSESTLQIRGGKALVQARMELRHER
jgi:type II secretory pathway component PulM